MADAPRPDTTVTQILQLHSSEGPKGMFTLELVAFGRRDPIITIAAEDDAEANETFAKALGRAMAAVDEQDVP